MIDIPKITATINTEEVETVELPPIVATIETKENFVELPKVVADIRPETAIVGNLGMMIAGKGKDGKDGLDGQPGKDGYTPQKGVDYFTPADKAEIVQQTAQQIKVPTKTSELTNDSGFLTQHQDLSSYAKVIVADTHVRNFSSTNLNNYCAHGHVEHWTGIKNRNDYKIGDICLLKAYNTSNNNQKVYIFVLALYSTSTGVQGLSLGYAPVEWS